MQRKKTAKPFRSAQIGADVGANVLGDTMTGGQAFDQA